MKLIQRSSIELENGTEIQSHLFSGQMKCDTAGQILRVTAIIQTTPKHSGLKEQPLIIMSLWVDLADPLSGRGLH